MIEAVIYDMDGVIIDSEKIYKEIERDMYAEMGISMTYEESLQSMGRGVLNWWKDLKQKYKFDDDPEVIAASEAKAYLAYLYDDSKEKRIMDGIEDCLRALKDKGFALGVASGSNPEALNRVMELSGLGDYFDVCISTVEVKEGKPHPEIFLKTAEGLGIKPENCMVIEDSYNGILAAKAAGMACVAYASAPAGYVDYSDADGVMHHHDELIEKFL